MQTIYLDISSKGTYPCINAKQSEVGRKFLAVITNNGVPYNIPQNSLLSVWYEGDTDAGNYSSIEEKSAFAIDGNKVTVELVAQMLLNPGKGELCLSITHGDGGETNTWNIPYCVEYKPGAGSTVPTEYYTALTEAGAAAAKQVGLAREQADRAKTEGESAAKSAKDAADSAAYAEAAVTAFAEIVAPVGYVFYWTPVEGSGIDLSTAEKVHNHFGFGTWEQIKDRFILAAGDNHPVKSVGGKKTHTMTVGEMPSHSHDFSGSATKHSHISFVRDANASAYPENLYLVDQYGTGASTAGWKPTISIGTGKQMITGEATVVASGQISKSGGGQAFSIMPPYEAYYAWKRIS